PAFFLIHGLRFTFLGIFNHNTGIVRLLVIIFFCCSFKIISSLIVSKIYGMSMREGLALGALMNVKGDVALIIMNAGN
ncbi:cation:proton antiporter, partial [Vibrio vulnificus]|nr:cation:proton antiporter [Vibrio vulnificus]